MRGNRRLTLRGAILRAVLLSQAALVLAVAAGVASFVLTRASPPGADGARAARPPLDTGAVESSPAPAATFTGLGEPDASRLTLAQPPAPRSSRAAAGAAPAEEVSRLLSVPERASRETRTEPLVRAARESEPPPRETVAGTPDLMPGDRIRVPITFYYCVAGDDGLPLGDGGNFCGAMRNGRIVYPGAAACDVVYLGQRFRILGDPLDRVYDCADTGSAVHGLHRDIWFYDSDDGWQWLARVGSTATIEILP